MKGGPPLDASSESEAAGPAPPLAAETLAMPGAIYSPFADQMAKTLAGAAASGDGGTGAAPRRVIPLHVGDTWRDPFPGARSEDLSSEAIPRLHAYSDTRGVPALIEAVASKLRRRNGLESLPEEILVTAGATGGLAALAGAALSPGDEMLILAPFWPLIRGIAQSFRAVPVEVPFFDRVASADEAVAALEARVSSKTRVLYVSTPSNPTGRVLPAEWLEAMAVFARRRNLWIFSDEVYEDYVYAGEHVSIARFAPERTVSVFSFSKSFAMAGQRVGYLVGPRDIVDAARKIGTHVYYHAPVAAQHAARVALEAGEAWLSANREQDRGVGEAVADLLGLGRPEGGTFLFMNVADKLDERGLFGFLEDAFGRGVLVAPGASCGEAYGEWVRISFTAAPAADVSWAAARLSEL